MLQPGQSGALHWGWRNHGKTLCHTSTSKSSGTCRLKGGKSTSPSTVGKRADKVERWANSLPCLRFITWPNHPGLMLSPRWLGLLAKLLDMNGETRQIPRQDVLAILHSINSILLSKWRSFRAKINPTALSEVLQGETQPHFTKSPQTQTQPPHSPNILLQYLWRVLVNFEWGNQKIPKIAFELTANSDPKRPSFSEPYKR